MPHHGCRMLSTASGISLAHKWIQYYVIKLRHTSRGVYVSLAAYVTSCGCHARSVWRVTRRPRDDNDGTQSMALSRGCVSQCSAKVSLSDRFPLPRSIFPILPHLPSPSLQYTSPAPYHLPSPSTQYTRSLLPSNCELYRKVIPREVDMTIDVAAHGYTKAGRMFMSV